MLLLCAPLLSVPPLSVLLLFFSSVFLPFFFFFLCLNEHSSVTELYNCIAMLASVCVEGGSGFL